jgi:hypothetical protein
MFAAPILREVMKVWPIDWEKAAKSSGYVNSIGGIVNGSYQPEDDPNLIERLDLRRRANSLLRGK